MLQEAGADFVADVRTVPRSRTNPQVNSGMLPSSLAAYHIGYRHVRRRSARRPCRRVTERWSIQVGEQDSPLRHEETKDSFAMTVSLCDLRLWYTEELRYAANLAIASGI